jgi:hypothetical protein
MVPLNTRFALKNSWSVRPKFLSKDGVDEWTALLAVIVEKYPNLRTTIVNNRKVCVDNNKKTRAH